MGGAWSNANVLGILFSRDRAMQLDATLRSFFRHCCDPDLVDLHVIYRVTGALHARQYAELEREHAARPNVHFVRQSGFRSDVMRLLLPGARRFGPLARLALASPRLASLTGSWGYGGAPLVLFLVDDNLFVRPFSLQRAAAALQGQPLALGFSLRLGANTIHCYTTDRPQTAAGIHGAGRWGSLLRLDARRRRLRLSARGVELALPHGGDGAASGRAAVPQPQPARDGHGRGRRPVSQHASPAPLLRPLGCLLQPGKYRAAGVRQPGRRGSLLYQRPPGGDV